MSDAKFPFAKEFFKKRKAKKKEKDNYEKETNSKPNPNIDKIFKSNTEVFNRNKIIETADDDQTKDKILEVINDDRFGYYRIMNIQMSDSQDVIKQAYKKTALMLHPDKGGNSDHFKYLTEAYKVLSDEIHKQVYDHFGRAKLQEVLASSDSNSLQLLINLIKQKESKENRIFSCFTDNGLSTLCEVNRLKSNIPTIKSNIKISLNEIYTGATINTVIKAARPCSICRGKGIEPQGVATCKCCNGSGEMQIPKYLNICSQKINSHVKCEQCRGFGEIVIVNKICTQCKGNKHKLENVNLAFQLEKGIHDGHTYELKHQGHEYVQGFKGDVVIQISIKPHKIFKVCGYDLYIDKTITLCESLCGVCIEVKHLDGKKYSIKSRENKVVSNEKFTVIGLGLPIFEGNNKYGNLIINFNVKFPNEIKKNNKRILNNILSNQANSNASSKNIKNKSKNHSNKSRRVSMDSPEIYKLLDNSLLSKSRISNEICYLDNFKDSHITKFESYIKQSENNKSDQNKQKSKGMQKSPKKSFKAKQSQPQEFKSDVASSDASQSSIIEDEEYINLGESDMEKEYFQTFHPSVHSYNSTTNSNFCYENIQCNQQ